MKGQMKGKRFACVSEVEKKTLEVLNVSTEELQKCFQQREKRWCKCIESKGEYFEED
jgi:GTP-dependent phosphoenolpyruvate carboxykinase